MTTRTLINQTRRRALTLALSGWLLFAAGGILATYGRRWAIPVAGLGFAGFMAGVLYSTFATRCAKCNGCLGYVVSWPPAGFSAISQKIKYCPFCGTGLDSEIN